MGKAIGGGGDDFISAAATVNFQNNTTVHGGGGADTLTFASSQIINSTVNGNGGNDLISAGLITVSSTLIGLGGGADTLTLVSGNFNTATIAAGGGNDLITATTFAGTNQIRIEGDTVGDTEFFGNDTIHINDGALGATALVQGGGGADQILLSANFGTGSTINGNAGKDSINIASGLVASGDVLIGGGAGADTISFSAAAGTTGTFATIRGGGENDVIDFNVAGVTGGAGRTQVVGGEGADTFNLGTTVDSGVSYDIRYTAFSESTLGSNDSISATVNITGGFIISQTVVSASTAANLSVGGAAGFTTTSGGIVTFGGNVANDVTARVTVLDNSLAAGQAVGFADGSGNDFFFIQGGSAAGGSADDLLVGLNTGLVTSGGMIIGGGTAIQIGLD